MTSIDLLLILFALIAIYGIWRYSKSEENDYTLLRKEILDLSAEIRQAKKTADDTAKISDLQKDQIAITKQSVDTLSQEIDQVQDHLQRIRLQQARLKEKMIPQKKFIKVQHVGAIPFEIHQPTPLPAPDNDQPRVEQLKKIRKQIDKLSK